LAEEALSPLHFDQHRFTQFLRGDPVSLDALRKTMREDELIVVYRTRLFGHTFVQAAIA
jgi:hypothetical protein